MKNIFFIGMRGAGKSTVGKLLSNKTKKIHRDLDEELIKKEGKSINHIVKNYGWDIFRRKEKDILVDICRENDQIVSTGGGIILSNENREIMKISGHIIFLFADTKTLIERINLQEEKRPALKEVSLEEEVKTIWEERKSIYKEIADITINTEDKSYSEILLEIEDKLDFL